jgi:hypothetical protein
LKPRRSALPLPRYVQRKPLKNGWGYFFNAPMWARKAGSPVKSEALGADYEVAVARAEKILLPMFDSWRTGGASDSVSPVAQTGTLDWAFAEYRADRRFTRLNDKTKRNHESGFGIVGRYVLKDGRRLGQARLSAITTAVTDDLYGKLLVVTETDANGNTVERERRTTVNHAMKSCRRAWNVAARRNPGKLPIINPFAAMGLIGSNRITPTATLAELKAFRVKAREMNLPSLATAALIGWDWLQRAEAIFGTFDVSHYRPKDHPDAVCVKHPKTSEETWFPLFDPDDGSDLYPELMAELDAIKRERIAGLMIRRDWGDRRPWPTSPKPNQIDLTHMSRKVKEVIRAASLREELTFTSFRHGGFTETGDAEMTDAETRAQGGHTTGKVLPKYVKRTLRQVASGAKKRRASRTKAGHLSE